MACGGVKAVGRGDADHVHVRVGQQGLVLHVHLRPAGGSAGGFQTRPIDVAHGHRLGKSLWLQVVDDLEMGLGAAAGADEADADALVGALGAVGGDGELGLENGSRSGRGRRHAEEIAAAGGLRRNRLFLVHGRVPYLSV